MAGRPDYVDALGDGVWRLRVWVQPGAKKDGPAGMHEGRLKLKVAAPAVDGKANQALIRLLARVLDVRASRVMVESGATSRKKTLRIEATAEPAWERLEAPPA